MSRIIDKAGPFVNNVTFAAGHGGVVVADSAIATDPAVSEAQRRAMWAAREGHSNIGIPKSVGEKFVGPGKDDAAADEKKAKAAVNYQAEVTSDDHCSVCEHFEKPNECKLVNGDISPAGWCKLFEGGTGAKDAIALDYKSARSFDADGRLHVDNTNISKANICPYMGREIPGWQQLGLDGDKTYRLLRHPDELKKGADTFNNVPLLIEHVPVSADDHKPNKIIGSTGTDAVFDGTYLRNSLVVWARDAIDAIEGGRQRELSCAYRYIPDMTPGTYKGEAYDGVMREIQANHVALVSQGRAGPDVMVGDSRMYEVVDMAFDSKFSLPRYDADDMTFDANCKEQSEMTTRLSRKGLLAQGALVAYLRPRIAMDEKINVSAILEGVTASNYAERKDSIVAAITKEYGEKLAKDASLNGIAAILGALDEMEVAEDEGTESEEDKAGKKDKAVMDKKKAADRKHAKDDWPDKDDDKDKKKAEDDWPDEDEDDDDKKKKAADRKKAADKKKAMDDKDEDDKDKVTKDEMAAEIAKAVRIASDQATRIQKEIREAENIARPWVGELNIAFDSAEQVYRRALKNIGVAGVDDVHPSALKMILEMQPRPGASVRKNTVVAQDAAGAKGFAERFPGAERIRVM